MTGHSGVEPGVEPYSDLTGAGGAAPTDTRQRASLPPPQEPQSAPSSRLEAADPSRQIPARREGERTVIVSSMASDAHTWNLVFLQLLIEELGIGVVNLGPCVPDDLLVAECLERRPLTVVLSSVNGHGYQDGLRVIARLRAQPRLAEVPVVIGGKLGISGGESDEHIENLLKAGFDAVYDDRADGSASFRGLVAALSGRADRELR